MAPWVWWLAVLYVTLVPVGRSGLPLNAQWGDLLFPLLVGAVVKATPRGDWCSRKDWPLAAYLAATLLAALVAGGTGLGLGQFVKQAYGVAVFLLFRRLTRDETRARLIAQAYALVMALVVASTIALMYAPHDRGQPYRGGMFGALPVVGLVERLRGPLEAPEMLGDAALVGFALALGSLAETSGRKRWVWIGIASLLAAGEALTFSHGMAGFAVVAALLLSINPAPRRLKKVAWASALGVVFLVNAASIVAPEGSVFRVRRVSLSVAGISSSFPLNFYAALKQEAWMAFVENPVFGVGPGGFRTVTEKAADEGRLTNFVRRHRPHCELTGRLAETGILGGISLLALWASWVIGIQRAWSTAPPIRTAAGAAVIGLLLNSLNADVMNFRFLWLALALAQAPHSPAEPESAG